jgi:hypothetical protein
LGGNGGGHARCIQQDPRRHQIGLIHLSPTGRPMAAARVW